jgi:hypothetical protein
MNITEPAVAEQAPQPYVSIPRTVTMATIAAAADEIPGLFGWLAARGVAPSGPPFLRYNVIDMERELQIEAGVPAGGLPGQSGRAARSGEVADRTGLPAGRLAARAPAAAVSGTAGAVRGPA